jgi:hypothetical protein
LSEEIIKQENKDKKTEFKMIQNENIVFKKNIDPITGQENREDNQ